MGTLYYATSLDVLKGHIADARVDHVYLDPRFNSSHNYNALFPENDGTAAARQIQAFKDTRVITSHPFERRHAFKPHLLHVL